MLGRQNSHGTRPGSHLRPWAPAVLPEKGTVPGSPAPPSALLKTRCGHRNAATRSAGDDQRYANQGN